jgi:hypothetical protein
LPDGPRARAALQMDLAHAGARAIILPADEGLPDHYGEDNP